MERVYAVLDGPAGRHIIKRDRDSGLSVPLSASKERERYHPVRDGYIWAAFISIHKTDGFLPYRHGGRQELCGAPKAGDPSVRAGRYHGMQM